MQQYATKSLMHFARTVKAGLERARAPYEGLWRDIRDNFEPTLGRELDDELNPNDATAKRGDEKILNSKPRDLVDRLAAGLQSGITNQARQWFRLIDKRENGRPEGNSQSERKAIDAATETLQTTIASSNVYSSLIAMYMRLGQCGTSCALLLPDEFATIRLDVIDEGAYWIGQDRRGRICTLLRRCKWTTRQLVDEFGREAIPPEYVNDFDSGRGETVRRVWHLVLPTSEVPKTERRRFAGHPFASIYWLDADVKSSVLRIGGFDYNPIIAARWATPTGAAYGVGLGQKALPDAKALQELERAILKGVAQEVDPPMAVPVKMRGQRFSLNPGAINYFTPGEGGQSAGHIPIQPIDQRQKRLEYVLQARNDLEQRLGRLFYEDLFAMLLQIQMGANKRQMTATEITELASEKIALLGPILTRLNHDLLDPLVGGIYAICRAEAMDQLDVIEGSELLGYATPSDEVLQATEKFRTLAEIEEMDLDVEYTSSLHVEQLANSRTLGVVRTYEYVGMIANYDPQVVDVLDGDNAAREGARSYMEHGIIRDTDKVAKIREGRAAQQEQQMQMAQNTKKPKRKREKYLDLSFKQDIFAPAIPTELPNGGCSSVG